MFTYRCCSMLLLIHQQTDGHDDHHHEPYVEPKTFADYVRPEYYYR